MPDGNGRSCSWCRFRQGETCRRFPPVPVADSETRGVIASFWPMVDGTDWCGEWQEEDD